MDFRKEGRQAAFEAFVGDVMKQYEAVGLAVSVFDKSDVLYEKAFGCRDQESQKPIDENTIFGLASVSKSFTAMSIMLLRQRGLVDLNEKVSTYIPEFRDPQDQPVLVWHLLCHSGGFFPMPRILVEHVAAGMGIWNGGKDELTFDESLALEGARQVAERMSTRTSFICKPGERMSYCNDGFGLLSEIVRRRGGEKSFAEFVKKNILEPLGMSRSCAEYIAPLHDENACTLYKHVGGKLQGGWDFYDNAFVLPGGGAMKSTLHDLRAYVRMYMNDGAPLTDEWTVREMTKIRQEYRFHSWYGYGIATNTIGNMTIHQHGGSLTGVSSNFAWCPELGIGVVVLCNTSGVPVSQISNALFRWFDGQEPYTEPQFHEVCWTKEQIEAACGAYQSGEGTRIEITAPEGRLKVTVAGETVDFITAAPDMLIVRHPFNTADMIFLSGGDGRPFAVRFGGRIVPREV